MASPTAVPSVLRICSKRSMVTRASAKGSPLPVETRRSLSSERSVAERFPVPATGSVSLRASDSLRPLRRRWRRTPKS